jgi:drug/metabolite transporter (DMT)-like permease
VLVAVRHAPVGYVAALRETSVLLAVVIGAKLLGEGRARLRTSAAAMIVSGLVLLVLAR